jgi:hypothetical protein
MDEQTIARIEQQLQDLQELVEENNELIHKMQRQARWAFWGKLVLWLIIIGLPIIFLGPIIHAILPYSTSGSGSVFGLPSSDQVKALIDAYQASGTPGK